MATRSTVEDVRPEYYEVNGTDIASRNRWWVITVLSLLSTVIAVVFAICVRMKPETVIRIGPHGETTVIGNDASQNVAATVKPGNDEFLNQTFVQRFLTNYLNYTPANVDEHWMISLNMMEKNLRGMTRKALTDANARGEIDSDQIQSVFHLRELDKVSGQYLTYVAYGVKDVHHVVNGAETTDHFVGEYQIQLVTDQRSKTNPDGLWISRYNERQLDGERRDQILAAQDTPNSQQ
ncbi:VirB8/TrbF family protein [Acidicapsa dinghuensis]|uniref:VirB8/TrbF family protein n=1 Tax=Acidicapsa dinghuensis TaxID=2218256 RepID=A0ABW1EFB0_9BACT|nr:VirB8/TrbF family protein [Acidicapsa dinghuensis]